MFSCLTDVYFFSFAVVFIMESIESKDRSF